MAKNSEVKDEKEISALIMEGLKVSFERLLERTKQQKGTLVFSENGKIVYYNPGDEVLLS